MSGAECKPWQSVLYLVRTTTRACAHELDDGQNQVARSVILRSITPTCLAERLAENNTLTDILS